MRLTLKNFGVYSSKTFEFPDEGLILLQGPSGKGKTTIFRAINYALIGEGTKLPTHGEVKCAVTFEFNGMKITRTNRPARVELEYKENKYANDEAQSVIYSIIGKHFGIAGYIKQKGENSFLSMTPADKLRFLEKVVFSDVPIDEIKDQAKKIVGSHELKVAHIQGSLSAIVVPNEPIDPNTGDFRDWKVVEKELEEINNQMKVSRHNLYIHQENHNQREHIRQQMEGLKCQDVPPPMDDCDLSHKEMRLRDYETFQTKQSEINDILTKYIIPHDKEVAKLQQTLDSLPEVKFEDNDELEGLITDLKDYNTQEEILRKKALHDPEIYASLTQQIGELEAKYASYVLGKNARKCPKCHTSLRLCDDSLQVYDGSYSHQTELDMKAQLTKLKNEFQHRSYLKITADKLPDITETIILDPVQVNERIGHLETQKKLIAEGQSARAVVQRNLASLQQNATIAKLRKVTEQKLEPVEQPPFTRKELDELSKNITLRRHEIERITKENTTKTLKLQALRQKYESIPPPQDILEIKCMLEQLSEHIDKKTQEKKKCMELQVKRDKYIAEYKNYTDQKTKRDTHVAQLTETETNLTNARRFKDTILKAEMLTISSIIEEINTHLAGYLNAFFPDNPITVDLTLFKESKDTVRSQVNIRIGYKGNIVDLNTLSGGEKDRVNLCFTLALAEIFKVPLLMVDETLSSLDYSTTESVLEHIRSEKRTIMVIAHQAIKGSFDHVYNL